MNLTQISGSAAYVGSVIVLALFALPSLIGAVKQSGIVRAVALFLTLGLFVIGYETLAVKTGMPYGKFSYGDALGSRLLGATPWIVALTYPPLLVGSFWLARKISIGFLTVLFTALFTTSVLALIGPAMSTLSLWRWENPGPYFGVPLRSFAGWFFSALIAAILTKIIWGDNEVKRLSAFSLFAIVLFWAGVNLGVSQLIPGVVGVVVAVLLLVIFRIEKRNINKQDS